MAHIAHFIEFLYKYLTHLHIPYAKKMATFITKGHHFFKTYSYS